jgi:uncharacterized protein YecT (DUF1311 family)
MRHLILTFALISLVATQVHAKDPEPEPKVDCANAMSTHDLRFCGAAELEAADKALNAAYQKALASIKAREDEPPPYDNKGYEAALRTAQRAWVAYRDADCNTVVPFAWTNGTGGPVAVLGCLINHTKARTKDLEDTFIEQ